jgi:hypothetical protein
MRYNIGKDCDTKLWCRVKVLVYVLPGLYSDDVAVVGASLELRNKGEANLGSLGLCHTTLTTRGVFREMT